MSLIIVMDKSTEKKKCLYTRHEAVEWLLSVNPNVPDKLIRSMEMHAMINAFAPNYTIIVNYQAMIKQLTKHRKILHKLKNIGKKGDKWKKHSKGQNSRPKANGQD